MRDHIMTGMRKKKKVVGVPHWLKQQFHCVSFSGTNRIESNH